MTSWYTTMQMEEPPKKMVKDKPKTKRTKRKIKKEVIMITPVSAENARQKELAKKT